MIQNHLKSRLETVVSTESAWSQAMLYRQFQLVVHGYIALFVERAVNILFVSKMFFGSCKLCFSNMRQLAFGKSFMKNLGGV